MTGRDSRDIDGGWAWVVAIAAYVITIINCTTLYMGGVFYIELLERYDEGKAKTSLVGALSSGLLCFLSPFSSIIINRFNCRITLFTGCVLTSVGFATTAFLSSLNGIIVTAGIIVGCGYALTVAAYIVCLGYYFQKRRNLMVSLSFVFVGIGMLFSAPLGLLILEEYGLSATFLILASLYLQTCVLAVLCMPSVLEKNFHRQRKFRRDDENNSEMHKRKSSYFNFYLLCNKPFLCFLISTSTWNFALTTGIMHLPNYLRVNGESDAEIGYYMTSFSVANTAGRMCGAFFSSRDNFNHLAAHFTSVGLAGVITLLFPLYSNGGVGKYSFSILLGLLCGCPNALMTVLAINFVGVSMLPEANALSYVFSGIGVTTGPIVSGFLFGITGSYRYSFVLAGSVLIGGSLLGVVSCVCRRAAKASFLQESCNNEQTDIKLLEDSNIIIEQQISVTSAEILKYSEDTKR